MRHALLDLDFMPRRPPWAEYAVLATAVLVASAVVFAGNYGEAGAIDRYGGARGLPRAYSGHNSYADFGVPPGSAGPVLVIGFDDPTTWFVGCRALDPIVMPHDIDTEEQGRPVWVCDAPVRAWSDLWSDLRHVD